ncbi:MAG: plasmid pRiA4b ORF-3 family protein [Muribaculaceae bacterium]|nr:plasmid pRiA4b ORF-3 family protein [Muribaculaceae bacterium]
MAKNKRGEREMSKELLAAFQGAGAVKDETADMAAAMYYLASRGITPDEYAQFCQIYHLADSVAEDLAGNYSDSESGDFLPNFGFGFGRGQCEVKEYDPLKDASDHTLVLKIQMKDVTKPPMWREVEIPADYNFLQLHDVIQKVVGFEDCHLWQFNLKAYDGSLQIGTKMDEKDPYGPGLDFVTHEAAQTPLTQFLQQKGDKLEYVYDFGDDWVFKVEVKELVSRKTDHPVCRKFKSELNAIEDFGGIWAYVSARENMELWSKMSKKDKKACAEQYGFDSPEEYIEFLNQNRIDLEAVNEMLETL